MKLKYRSDIDGLRAIAVLIVVIFHAFPRMLSGGFIGVDVFFVISGYLITSIIAPEIYAGTFSFGDFYSRRVKRIFPALLLVLAVALVLGYCFLLSDEYGSLGRHVFGGGFFASNFVLLGEVNYFDVNSDLKPLLHLWSLGIEEQFYIFWPLMLLLVYRWRLSVKRCVVGLFLISFVLNCLLISKHPTGTFYMLPTRAWELLAGAFLTFYTVTIRSKIPPWVAVSTLALGAFLLGEKVQYPGGWALIPVLSTAALIASEGSWINRNILSSRFMVWLGRISYPLYLWHWSLLSFARITTPQLYTDSKFSYLVLNAIVVMSILLAHLTYIVIEKPIKNSSDSLLGGSFSKIAFRFVLGSVTISFFALFVWIFKPVPMRTQLFEKGLARTKYFFGAENNEKCQTLYLKKHFCSIADISREPTALLVGDSLANQYFPGLSLYMQKSGRNLLVLADNATPPLLHVGNDRYNDLRNHDDVFSFIERHSNIREVILAFSDYANDRFLRSVDGKSFDETLYEDSLKRTIQFLIENGKKVIFFIQNPPMLDFDHHQCVNLRPRTIFPFKGPLVCGVKKNAVLEEQKTYRKSTLKVLANFPEVVVFDPMNYLCDGNYCYAAKGEEILYAHDSTHLSIAGSEWIAKFFKF